MSNGIFFINQATQAEVKVAFVATNNPKNLILLIPALSAVDYTIKIVTQYNGGGTMLKKPRNILFDKVLTIS